MSNDITKEIYDAIARWIDAGNLPPRLGTPVAQRVMQPIIYVPKQQPDLPAEREDKSKW